MFSRNNFIILILILFNVFLSRGGYSQEENRQKDIRKEIISTFKKLVQLNEDFKSSVDSGVGKSGRSYHDLRKEVESYGEDFFDSKLKIMKNTMCKNEDRELLTEFFNVLISIENSANEYPRWILGDVYLCQPDLVVTVFKKLEKPHQRIIYNDLDFGFRNVTYNREIPNYSKLKKKLESLAIKNRD